MSSTFYNLQSNRYDAEHAQSLASCNSGHFGIQSCCCSNGRPKELPARVTNQSQLTVAQLGPILDDNLVPEFTVIVSHPQSSMMHYLEAHRVGRTGQFAVTDWNPQSLSRNCCSTFLGQFDFSSPPGRVSVQTLINHIEALLRLNSELRNPQLQISFRSKSGFVHTALLA